MRKILLSALLTLSTIASPTVGAADYPTRPIKFIVPFTPGTGMDRIARKVGEKLHARLGQPVVVDNRTGVSGHLGAQLVAQSPADGYTFLVSASNLTITASLYPSQQFNPMTDLTPMLIAAWGNATLVANPKTKSNNLREIVAQAKANPGKMTFATPGVGSPSHMALEQFQQLAGVKFLHVPYKGTGPALTDLVGGHVDLMFVATHTVMPYVTAGQVKPVAVGSNKRHSAAPTIPAFDEAGVAGFSTDAWYGFLAPKGTPPDILAKLGSEIRTILALPEIKADLQQTGLEVRTSTAEEMRAVMQREYSQYAEIIKKNDIKPE